MKVGHRSNTLLFAYDDFALSASPKETLRTLKPPPEHPLNRNSSFCNPMSIAKESIFFTTNLPSPSEPKVPDPHGILLLPREQRDFQSIRHHQTSHKKERKPSSTRLFTWETIVSPPNLTRDACSCFGNRNSKPKEENPSRGTSCYDL